MHTVPQIYEYQLGLTAPSAGVAIVCSQDTIYPRYDSFIETSLPYTPRETAGI